jgi:hypothetical protein
MRVSAGEDIATARARSGGGLRGCARAARRCRDQLRAIEHLALEEMLEVPSLRGRKLVIEDHGGDLLRLERVFDDLRFAFADVVRRGRLLEPLRHRVDDRAPAELASSRSSSIESRRIPLRDAVFLESDKNRELLSLFRLNFNHPACAKERRAFCAIHSIASDERIKERFSGSKLVCPRNQVNCLLA